MKALGLFLLLLAACLLAGAGAAPWVLRALPEGAGLEVHQLITPLAKLCALPLTLLLLIRLGLWGRRPLALALGWRLLLREIGRGWLLGLAIIAPLAALLLWSGARTPAPWPSDLWALLWRTVLIGLLAGLLVGLVEELFFRGAVYGAMRQERGFVWAAIGSSLYYAALHFIAPRRVPTACPPQWDDGLRSLGAGLYRLAEGAHLDSLLALWMVGLLLALVRERRGNLGLCIGMHAAWVFAIRLLRDLSNVDWNAPASLLVGRHDGVVGWLATGYLALLMLLALAGRALPRGANQDDPRALNPV